MMEFTFRPVPNTTRATIFESIVSRFPDLSDKVKIKFDEIGRVTVRVKNTTRERESIWMALSQISAEHIEPVRDSEIIQWHIRAEEEVPMTEQQGFSFQDIMAKELMAFIEKALEESKRSIEEFKATLEQSRQSVERSASEFQQRGEAKLAAIDESLEAKFQPVLDSIAEIKQAAETLKLLVDTHQKWIEAFEQKMAEMKKLLEG